MDADCALLLTATVAPDPTTRTLAVRDPREREAEYLDALGRWCRTLPPSWEIAVAENSGWPTSVFADAGRRAGREVHVLACEDRGSEVGGKSAGEAELIDDFAGCELAQRVEWIFKCTGRLFVENVEACLPRLDRTAGVCGAIVPTLDHMDSRFFGASRAVFHEYFTGMGPEMDETTGMRFEVVAARRMLAALAAGNPFRPFAALPYFIGRSGSLDAAYNSAAIRAKWFLRQQVRRTVISREILI